jgi:hypothetical protein
LVCAGGSWTGISALPRRFFRGVTGRSYSLKSMVAVVWGDGNRGFGVKQGKHPLLNRFYSFTAEFLDKLPCAGEALLWSNHATSEFLQMISSDVEQAVFWQMQSI